MDEHVIRNYARAEEVFVSGKGCSVRDANGKEFLDFLSGLAVTALGYAYPPLVEAMRDQVGKLVHVSNLFRHPYTELVAGHLARHTELAASFFTNSGTESNEAAIKLARKYQRDRGQPERTSFVALHHAFHGRTCGSISITYKESYRAPFGQLLPVTFVPADDPNVLVQVVRNNKPAAVFLEPIQGEGGIYPLSHEFLRAARSVCDETGTLLVHDEIQSGLGRTGRFLAADWAGVKPDVITLAKPIAAGLPMGVMVVRQELAEVFKQGDHGSTFGGGPLVCRAALVFFEALEDGLLENVRVRGEQLGAGLERLRREFPLVAEVRGRGLMRGLRMARDAQKLQRDLYARGLIVNCTAGDVIRILPAFVVTAAEVDRGLEILAAGLRQL
jgi:acetylornithine aminotransferase/acetylornithine/N-succinyldiaminopimelate aminotransferase